jgi:hypothetical protein
MADLQALSEALFTSDEGREGMAAFAERAPMGQWGGPVSVTPIR